MAEDFYTGLYNPDVLSCLANLSSDEVFTPPDIANQMLDLLPHELFQNPETKFLDPACKSGIFLREIAKRLLKGLEPLIPDLEQRIDHIFHHQIYGIAITELTSLLSRRGIYCSKYPNSIYSVTEFEDAEGNIRFKRIKHSWKNGNCVFCGASQSEYERDESLETHAYELIHTTKSEEIFNMKFDVIISNPPYQLSDSGHGMSAKPIYQHFVAQAKKLNPRYLTMIIPSRWFSGGKGLDNFRKQMLTDKRIRKLVDYENFKDVFPGVDLAGGACYFLWDRDYDGPCEVINFNKENPSIMIRHLNEYDTFIRQNLALNIIRKVQKNNFSGETLTNRVSSRKPFGLPTNYVPRDSGVPCWFIQRIGLAYAEEKDVDNSKGYLDQWKLLIPKAPIAGQTDFSKPVGFYYDGNVRVSKPGECCTESWLIAGAFDTKKEVLSYKSYLFTKIIRFMLLQTVVSQDVTKKNFIFIPDLGKYEGVYTDNLLREKWNISDEEWIYIDSRISSIGDNNHGE
jgi:site-specific DNA-methyltransferase (adenine-specific)